MKKGEGDDLETGQMREVNAVISDDEKIKIERYHQQKYLTHL